MTSKISTLVFISAGLFGAILLAVIVGDAIVASGAVKNPTAFETPAKIVFFALFVAFGFSLIPLMVALVFGGLDLVGKGLRFQPFQPLISRPGLDVWPIWGIMALGFGRSASGCHSRRLLCPRRCNVGSPVRAHGRRSHRAHARARHAGRGARHARRIA